VQPLSVCAVVAPHVFSPKRICSSVKPLPSFLEKSADEAAKQTVAIAIIVDVFVECKMR
jgi:hypothetical protein